jgi:DNA-binding transcriptional LysR family regulator
LIQVLALEEHDVEPERITLICIGDHLGIAHFGGLGELDAEQLERAAAGAAIQLSPSALDLARAAWAALRSDDPSGLAALATTHHPELRFLGEALDRLSREYPSSRDGLSLTERRILSAATEEPSTLGAVFTPVGARETRSFLSDSLFFRILRRLAGARTPPLEVESSPIDASSKLRLTASGQRVRDSAEDYIRLNGIDRWIGGVHLAGDEARWRWDGGTETIIAS